jgi:glutamate 5-kinase
MVDEGARRAVVEGDASLLPAGVISVTGRFDSEAAVEIVGPDGIVFAKGLVRHPAERIGSWAGRRTSDLPEGVAHEIVHRDDLVVLA